jgi:aldose sugar dehydrogenase
VQTTSRARRRCALSAAGLAWLLSADPVAQPPQFPYPTERDLRVVLPADLPPPWPSVPLGDGPFVLETLEQRDIRVVVMARGFTQPRSLAFLPDGAILITERAGRLRIVRNGVLDPEPIAGVPEVVSRGTMAGLMSIALHPDFDRNRWIYISYHKPVHGSLGSNAIVRGTWDGRALTDVRDIFVSDDVDMEVSRLAFGRDGMLYMTVGGPGTGPEVSLMRAQNGGDHAGKVLRFRDDGSVPPDNPFVGRPGYKPEIYTVGHRNQLGLAVNPYTGELWATEQGPNGGDEVNILQQGRNYGWPVVSDGRDYLGPFISPSPYREGMERPHILWVPSIAASGMEFYTGDRFPAWQRNLFVGGMREGEVPRTGQLIRIVFNENWEELRREPLLRQIGQRIRDVRQGPDGLLYVITAEDDAALLRIEPVPPGTARPGG